MILCCLVIYIGGYHLVYVFYQYNLKQEMRAYLQTHKDTRFGTYLDLALVNNEVTDPSFEWEETNQEFRYKGEMYDVVSVQKLQTSIHICALKDDRENDLEKQISSIRHTNNENGSNPVLSLMKFFSAFDITESAIVFSPIKKGLRYFSWPCHDLISVGTDIHSPPPRC